MLANFRKRIWRGGLVVPLLLVGLAACAPPPPPPTPAPPTAVPPTPAPTAAPAAATGGGPTIKLARIEGFGLFLTDDADMTLYAFDNDKKDSSVCAGDCLKNWPPYIVKGVPQASEVAQGNARINAALLSAFARGDGKTQGQYENHPLYYYVGDKKAGDVTGHGVGGVWHVLSPRGNPMTNAAPAPKP